MSFQQEFVSVLEGGEGVLRRLSTDPQRIRQTVDVLRVLIKCRLESGDSELSKTELASALILFSELYPKNTEPKMAVLKSLCDEIVGVARALSEEDNSDEQFYAQKLWEGTSPLKTVMLDAIECVHPEWATRIRDEVENDKVGVKKAKLEKIGTHALGWLLYLGSSCLLCYLVGKEVLSVKHYVLACIPGFGQLVCMKESFSNYGFWKGMASILGGLFVVSFLVPACTGDWDQPK